MKISQIWKWVSDTIEALINTIFEFSRQEAEPELEDWFPGYVQIPLNFPLTAE